MIDFFWSPYLPALRKFDMYLGGATRYGNIATGVCSHGMCHFLFAYLGVASFGVLWNMGAIQVSVSHRLLKVAGV